MCAIFGSKKLDEFVELAELNASRGSISYSIMGFDDNLNIVYLVQGEGDFPQSKAKDAFEKSSYCIGHIQAPTKGITKSYTIHPAHYLSYYLYHNGMIRSQALAKYKSAKGGDWDTMVLLKELINGESYSEALSDVDGSFTCLLIDAESKSIKLFLNKSCTLYRNSRTSTISSTKFKKSQKVKHEIIYDFNPITNKLVESDTFTSFDDIYFIPKDDTNDNTPTNSASDQIEKERDIKADETAK